MPKADAVQQILDAAKHCYLNEGISKTGMREVAAQAGIARSTLYRYFPGRDDVLVGVIKREMEIAEQSIQKKLSKYERAEDYLVEGLILAMKIIPRQPLLKAVFASDTDPRARRVIWNSKLIVNYGNELLENVIRPAQELGLLQDSVKPEVLVEWVYRVLLSFLTLPSNWVKSDAQLRATLHALLVPVILR